MAKPWLRLFALVALASGMPAVQAQDLKAELDALDELPEDDLSGFSPADGSEGNLADDPLMSGESEVPPPASGSAGNPPPASLAPNAASGKGLNDLDLQGLEAELKFDDFKDGGALTADDLNESDLGKGTLGEAQGSLVALDFKQLSDRVRLVVRSNRPVDWSRELRSKRRQVIVELRNMKISKAVLRRALDTGEFEGPVALVQAFEAAVAGTTSVKILFQLRQFVDPTVLRMGNELIIDFPLVTGLGLFRTRAGNTIVPKTYISASDVREFKGGPISLNVKEAALSDVLNLISKSAGKNFVLAGTAGQSTKVTVNLQGVPWDQALGIILFNNGLGYQDLDTIYRIATIDELQKELDAIKTAATKIKDLIPIETRIIPVNYAKADEVNTNIKDFLSVPRGKASVDKRSNSIVISDIPEVVEQVERYVRAIDRQTPQVLIEGRIVQASEDFSRNRNFAWGLGDGGDGNITGNLNIGTQPPLDAAAQDNFLRLRTANPLGDFGRVTAFLRLSEEQNQVKTVASPRVTVLNNEKAVIRQGQTRSRTVLDDAGNPIVQSTPINTTLDVTPQVTSDGFVTLTIVVNRDTPRGAEGTEADTRSAETKMMIKSGETGVIGGIYTMEETAAEAGLPFLRGLPVFGKLFQNEVSSTKSMNELIMFISPRILNPDSALMMDTAAQDEDDAYSSSALRSTDESSPANSTF
jgi:type IV pilus assembly protein PilQ